MGVGFTCSPTQKSSSVLCDPSNSTQLSSTYVTSEVILNNFCTEAEPRPPCSASGTILLRAATGKVQRQVLETSIRRGGFSNCQRSVQSAAGGQREQTSTATWPSTTSGRRPWTGRWSAWRSTRGRWCWWRTRPPCEAQLSGTSRR